MIEWYTAAEIAALALPGTPATVRGVNKTADRDGWQDRISLAGQPLARKRQGRGGGWEYHYSLLPDRAQAALVRRAGPKAPAPEAARAASSRADLWAWFDRQPDKKKRVAREKMDALLGVKALERGGLQTNLAVAMVAAQRGKSARTVYNWRDEVAGLDQPDWLPTLCPRHAGRTATVECDPRAWEFLKADYLRPSQPKFAECYERLQLSAAAQGWQVPSARTLERRMAQEVPRAVQVYLRRGADALKKLYPPQERDRSMFHAMEAVNVDGHKWDVFVKWPDGTIVRPMMVAIQDLYSNKIVAWRIDRSENTDAVRLAFKDCFEEWGIPDHCYLDNGRAFASKYISGGAPTRYRFKVKPEEPVGVLTALGIQLHWTTPYSGQSKPIERAFRDLCSAVARHPAFEGAYTGNTIEAKPENYNSRAVELDTFLAVVDAGIRLYNARDKRRTAVCAGVRSFDQAFEASYRAAPIRKATAEQLRMCMLAAESVRADRDSGSIRLLGNRYWSESLIELAGKPVTVRFDPDDLHGGVHVYRQDGVYAAFAECLEAAGFADAEAARRHSRTRRDFVRKHREAAAAERKLSIDELVALMPEIEEPAPPAAKVVRMVGNTALKVAPDPENDADPAMDYAQAFRAGLSLFEGGRNE